MFALLLFASSAHGAECSSIFSDATGVNENLPVSNRLTFDTSGWAALSGPWPSSGTELAAGDYYFYDYFDENNDDLPNNYVLNIAEGAKVRIFVDGDLRIGNNSLINSGGTADQLLLLVDGEVDIRNGVSFTGLLYATDKIDLSNNASVEGVLASEDEINFANNADFVHDPSAVNPGLLDDLCETPGADVLPVVDTFESYSPGSIDGRAGGTGWGGPWSGNAGQTLVDSSADPLLFQADNGLSIRSLTTLEVSGNDNRIAVRSLDGSFTGDSLYMSMLVRFEGTPANNNFLAFWVQSAGYGDSPQFGVKVNEGGGGTDDFFVRLDTNADYSTDLVPGQTYLLVAQFEKDGAGYFNRGRLWVDPQCTDAPPPATSAFVNNNPASQVTEISEIGLRSFNLSGEKRIQVGQVAAGEQWTDVVQCAEAASGLDHFRISHGGSAVTCQPSPVTIEAMDAEGVPVADYDGTVSLSTSTGNGDWLDGGASAGTLTRGLANSGSASYNFVPADGGVITLNLSHTLAQLVNVDVDDAGIGESPGFDPDIDFRETGFIFHQGADLASPIPQQIAGRPSNTAPDTQDLRLSAVRTNDDTGACEAFLTEPQTVEMGYVCDSPGGCGLSDAVTVNGSTVASNNSGGMANSSPVTFDFGDDTETSASLTLTHADAGRISLFAQLALEDAEDSPTGGMLTGTSNLFVSVPAGFCIEAIDPASECTGDPAQCSVFTSAGSDFDVRYRAVAWQTGGESGTDFCTGNNTTPGFERNGLELTHQVLAPSSGEAGDLGLEQVSFGTAEQGNTIIAQSLSEVGVFELQLVPGQTWLGTTLPGGNSAPVGRLTPASFNVQVADPGALAPACEVSAVSDGFLYSGQSTGWDIEPELLITARNTLGDTTTNYTRGDFLKLIAGDVLRDMPEEDSSQVDADGADLLPVAFAEQVGALSVVVGEPGQMTYQFSSGDAFSYPKSGLSLVAPFGPELSFGITQVVDSDSVAANSGLPIEFTPEADFELRYGRLALSNVYGPETIAELQMLFQAEYWNGDRFVLNTEDGCWAWDTADVANAATTTTSHHSLQANTGTLVGGQGTLVLEPGGSRGEDTLGWIVPVWLQHFWTQGGGLENPSALATFGVYRGHDRVIYWRER